MSIRELNTLHHICQPERTQFLTILAMSIRIPHFAGYLLTRNHSNFLYVEGSAASVYDCPDFLSPQYEADKRFVRIPLYYQGFVRYIDSKTGQIFNYATPMSCDNNPQNVIALDPDTDKQYVLTPKPVLRAEGMFFETKQSQCAISPNTFTAQKAGIYSNAEITNSWNSVFFTKNSDNTLRLLGKAILYHFLAISGKDPTD